ncbi:signal peptidase I [Candidatus Woesearchaeota archaeon]|nr:signal peptidase I [Candidatus Woesearchaeota archaeon]
MMMEKKENFFRKFWNFLWNDDSLASWIVNIVLAFVLIKFVVYPFVGLLFGTGLPVVAVVSESMEHNRGFDQWWSEEGDYYQLLSITEKEFRHFPFRNGFNKGDIMILVGKEPEEIRLGDVIVFQSGKPYPIIHRVIVVEEDHFQTKGDNNPLQIKDIQLDETRVVYDSLLGKAVFRIPFLGYVKIWAVDLLNVVGLGYVLG